MATDWSQVESPLRRMKRIALERQAAAERFNNWMATAFVREGS